MKTPKLSVVLATHNEEDNIGRCLEAVKDIADEIVVVDGKSSDQTVQIAKKYGARVIIRENPANFHINKNIAINAAKGDWVLQLDADEVVSPELAAEIKEKTHLSGGNHLKGENMNGYWVNRRNWFLSRFLTKGGQYPDPTLRLYRREKGRLPAKDVHEQAVVDGPVGHLKHDLLHYRDTSFTKYLDGVNRYSSFAASQMQARHEKHSLLNALNYLILLPLLTFLKIYFRHLGLVDGYPGFVFALFSGLTHAMAYIKYWQRSLD